jgi:hypothetical protein
MAIALRLSMFFDRPSIFDVPAIFLFEGPRCAAHAGFAGRVDAASLPRGDVTTSAWAIDLQNEQAFPMAGAVSLQSQR